MVNVIAKAEALVRRDAIATADAVMRVFPALDRRKVDTIVRLYQPAVPASPHVSVEGLRRAAALFPASRTAPSLDGIDLAMFIDDTFAIRAAPAPAPVYAVRRSRGVVVWIAAAIAIAAAGILVAWRRLRGA